MFIIYILMFILCFIFGTYFAFIEKDYAMFKGNILLSLIPFINIALFAFYVFHIIFNMIKKANK